MIKIISLISLLSFSAGIFAADSKEEHAFWAAIENEDYGKAHEILAPMPAPIRFNSIKVQEFSDGVEQIKPLIPLLPAQAILEAQGGRKGCMYGLEALAALEFVQMVKVHNLMKEKEKQS